MRVKVDALEKLAKKKGWSIPDLAEKLGVEYSYLYRVLNRQKNGGTKLFSGIYMLCKQENIDVEKYIFLTKPLSVDKDKKRNSA